MINRFLTFLLLVVSAVAASAANPTLENFDQTHFRTNAPAPGIIRTRLSASNFDQSGDTWTITNVSGATGASLWSNHVDNIMRVIEGFGDNGIETTNHRVYKLLNNQGGMVLNGVLSSNLVAGVNELNPYEVNTLRLTGFSATTTDSTVTLSGAHGPGQLLIIENYTDGFGFCITNNTPLWDNPLQTIILPNGDWCPTAEAEKIWLQQNGHGDWVEVLRVITSGPGFAIINPTDNFMPYRIDANTFGDSPIERTGSNSMRVTAPLNGEVTPFTFRNLDTTAGTGQSIKLQWNLATTAGLEQQAMGLVVTKPFSWTSSAASYSQNAFEGLYQGNIFTQLVLSGTGNAVFFNPTPLNSDIPLNRQIGWELQTPFFATSTQGQNSPGLAWYANGWDNNLAAPTSVQFGAHVEPYENPGAAPGGIWTLRTFTQDGDDQTVLTVNSDSGYTGAGTLFLSDDGTYKAAGGGGGTTINPTDNVIPVRTDATTFGDSPIEVTSSTSINIADRFDLDVTGVGTIPRIRFYPTGAALSALTSSNGFNINIDGATPYQWRFNALNLEPQQAGSVLASATFPLNAVYTLQTIWGDGGSAIGWVNAVADSAGNGDPEGVLAAGVGSVYRDTNGTPGTVLYVKESGGDTSTGWTALGAGGPGGSANWTGVGTTNSTLAGEATVDTLRIETTDPLNIPLVIDAAAGHTNWMANVNNGGTNYLTIDRKGNIGIGITNVFPNKTIGITRVYDREGSNDPAWINIGALDTYPSYNFAGEWWVKAGTNDVIMQSSWLGAGGVPTRDLRFYNGSADPLFYIATAVDNVEKFKVMGATGDITTPGFVRADTMRATNGIAAGASTFTGAVGFADGATATPSIAWTSDQDGTGTGFYRHAANDISGVVNGNRMFRLNASGVTILSDTLPLIFGSSADVMIVRDGAANTLALRNGANAQTFNIYNTYTDASNYERGFIRWNANVFEIGATGAGTGNAFRKLRLTADSIDVLCAGASVLGLGNGGAAKWNIINGGHLVTATDNAFDFGAVNATRPRNGFFGGDVTVNLTVGTAVTLSSTNHFYLCNVDAQTVTLPTAVGIKGKEYEIKLISPATTGTVATTSSQLIDGAASYSLSASNKFVRVVSDGTNWWNFGSN